MGDRIIDRFAEDRKKKLKFSSLLEVLLYNENSDKLVFKCCVNRYVLLFIKRILEECDVDGDDFEIEIARKKKSEE